MKDPSKLHLAELGSLYPEGTAEYFGIPVKNLKNYVEGKKQNTYMILKRKGKIEERIPIPSEIRNIQRVLDKDGARILRMINEYNIYTQPKGSQVFKGELDIGKELIGKRYRAKRKIVVRNT